MTIAEISNVISSWFSLDGELSFLHAQDAQINPWPIGDTSRTFPLAVLDPPSYTGNWIDQGLTKTFRVELSFLDTLAQDHTSTQQLTIVNAMEAHAMRFVIQLGDNAYNADNFDNTVIDNVQVIPVMRYQLSAHLLAGVLLYFDLVVMDTFDYCSGTVPNVGSGGSVAVVGSAIVG